MSKKKIIFSKDICIDNFSLNDIGNAFKDITKIASAPLIVVGQKIANKPVDLKLETGIAKKAAATGVGKFAQDTVRLGVAPLTNAISSVKGQPINNGYVTKTAKILGKLNDVGNQGVNIVSKSFADTITGGLASKAKNALASKIDPKGKLGYVPEKAYSYGEMTPSQSSGVKILDKAASYVPIASAVVGTLAGAKVGGDIVSNMKPTNIEVGNNVLKTQQPIVIDSPIKPISNGLPNNLPAGVLQSDIPLNTGKNINLSQPSMASFGSFDFKNPFMIGGIIVLIILILSVSKTTSNA